VTRTETHYYGITSGFEEMESSCVQFA